MDLGPVRGVSLELQNGINNCFFKKHAVTAAFPKDGVFVLYCCDPVETGRNQKEAVFLGLQTASLL